MLLEKKAEAKALLEKEMDSIKKPSKVAPPAKITRAQIESTKQQPVKKEKEKEKVVETHLTIPLEENINRVDVEEEEARNITEAIAILR